MRMYGKDNGIPVLKMLILPLYYVRIDIRRRHLDCSGQIDYNLIIRRSPPCVNHGVTDL